MWFDIQKKNGDENGNVNGNCSLYELKFEESVKNIWYGYTGSWDTVVQEAVIRFINRGSLSSYNRGSLSSYNRGSHSTGN